MNLKHRKQLNHLLTENWKKKMWIPRSCTRFDCYMRLTITWFDKWISSVENYWQVDWSDEFSHWWKLSYVQSLVKKIVLFFLPFPVCSHEKRQQSDGVVFGHLRFQWRNSSKDKKENWAEYCSAEGISDAKRRVKSYRRNCPRRTQFIHYNSEKVKTRTKIMSPFIAWYVSQLWKVFEEKKLRLQRNKRHRVWKSRNGLKVKKKKTWRRRAKAENLMLQFLS